jgi:hypothetical protein
MVKPLMIVIRAVITLGVTTLPLKRESHPDIEVKVKAGEVLICYLDERNSG